MSEPDVFEEQIAAEAFLRQLKAFGIDRYFVNAGTDFAPLIEAYARAEARADDPSQLPRPIVGAHENLVIGMAHGAYLMSGKPQLAMFHVNVGTANAICGAINAAKERIPLILAAGRTPYLEYGKDGARDTRTNWGQEMFDQAAMVREVVKWDYELKDPLQVGNLLSRAFTLATTEPKGPVYISLPREVLAAEVTSTAPAERLRPNAATAPHPDPAAVKALADRLIAARFPVVSALASGADRDTVPLLAELCDRFAIGYVEELARYLNFPHDHPLHFGYKVHPVFADADAICFLESDVPWVQRVMNPAAETFIAQCGVDPHFAGYPMRSHRSDLSITSSIKPLLAALIEELGGRIGEIDSDRRARLETAAASFRKQQRQDFDDACHRDGPMGYEAISEALGEVLHEDCILFNEYFAHPIALNRMTAGSYFFMPASGGLGWSLPAAIGAKIESSGKTCVAAIGDGSYLFTNPAACHHAARKHDAPVLTVICNNAYWNTVDSTAKMAYPTGHLNKPGRMELADISPSAELEQYVVASGGVGEVVTRREDLVPALRRAMHAVEKERRQAVVNVICN